MNKKPHNATFEGTISVCAHHVSFWFRGDSIGFCDELKARLTEAAEERAKSQITEGYIQGELCYVDSPSEREYSGWWKIEN
jgi:hypothetical protein